MNAAMNVLALCKGSERYVFLYDDESIETLQQTLSRYAADKSLSFTWYDAAVLSMKIRKLREESEGSSRLEPEFGEQYSVQADQS